MAYGRVNVCNKNKSQFEIFSLSDLSIHKTTESKIPLFKYDSDSEIININIFDGTCNAENLYKVNIVLTINGKRSFTLYSTNSTDYRYNVSIQKISLFPINKEKTLYRADCVGLQKYNNTTGNYNTFFQKTPIDFSSPITSIEINFEVNVGYDTTDINVSNVKSIIFKQ